MRNSFYTLYMYHKNNVDVQYMMKVDRAFANIAL